MSVPVAGLIALAWLLLGGVLYVVRFAGRAAAFDAASEGTDPALVQSRGRNPLVLVPLRNAANAASMVAVAHAVSPPGYGRVLLLNVVRPPETWSPGEAPESLLAAEEVVRQAMTASFAEGLTPQAMLTVSSKPLDEIRRVARTHHCDSVLVGLRDLTQPGADVDFDRFLDRVAATCSCCARRPTGSSERPVACSWPSGGRGRHSPLRARLLGSLRRFALPDTTYLCVLPELALPDALARMQRRLRQQADDEIGGSGPRRGRAWRGSGGARSSDAPRTPTC